MATRVLPMRATGSTARGSRAVPVLTVTIPVLVALGVHLWAVSRPSLWRDESVTIGVAGRSVGDMLRVLSHIDAVHGLYYLLMHPVVTLFGTGETAVRLPSVLAAAAAAGLTAALGLRLADVRVGLVAGLLVAVSPTMSRYAQEARQYTWVTALAVAATLLLVRALERRDRGDGARGAFAAYGVVLALMGWVHMFSMLLVLPHAVLARREPRRWAVAAGCAVAAVLPLVAVSVTQRAQVDWITRPDGADLWFLGDMLAGTRWLIAPTAALVVLALWRPSRGAEDPRWGLAAWLVLPPALLMAVSFVVPTYLFRYVLFCFPAVALLVALGLRRLPGWAAAVVLGVVVVALVPTHRQVREPDSRVDDLRSLSAIIRDGKRPGDAILFHQWYFRRVMGAYPDAYTGLRDISLARTGTRSATIDGEEVRTAELARRLAGVERLWYVHRSSGEIDAADRAKDRLVYRSGDFRKVKRWRFKGGSVTLFENRRPGTAPGASGAVSPAGGGRDGARPARPAPG